MNYMTTQKNVDYSPRKMREVADMIRKMSPAQAVEILSFTNKAGAIHLQKAIKTVLANAGNTDGLTFKSIEINEGLKLKRYRVGTAGRGRGRPYRKRFSHIKIVLTDEVRLEEPKKVEKVKKLNVIANPGSEFGVNSAKQSSHGHSRGGGNLDPRIKSEDDSEKGNGAEEKGKA